MICNKSLPTEASDDEMITRNNCKITTLLSLLKAKLVCHILVNTEYGMRNYTCFNDAVQSFLAKIKNMTPFADNPLNDLKKLLLKARNQRMIVGKTANIRTRQRVQSYCDFTLCQRSVRTASSLPTTTRRTRRFQVGDYAKISVSTTERRCRPSQTGWRSLQDSL